MAFEWVAGLFQGDNQQTRGLSRDQSNGVALDNSNPYYNYRLKRHSTDGDLIADPALLWYTSPYVKRRSGLGTHVGAEVGEGTANYTDVLIVIAREDWPRASAEWQSSAAAALQREFDHFCRRENFTRIHPHRPLGVRIVEDGGQAMQGQYLGLARGEFVTGLLPNLYTGPVRGSYPVIGVHLNLPGVWDGYREVGRMYNDQILFTIGNHWLDNFHHPSLQQAALYRLRQYSDGSFLHIVNPDLQDQYQVTSTNQGGGASVLTLATRTGQPLAYMVLAVIDPPRMQAQGAAHSNPGLTPVPADPPRSAPPAWQTPAPGPVGSRRPNIQMPNHAHADPRGHADPKGHAESRGAYPAGSPAIAPPMMLDDARSGPNGAPNGGGGLGGPSFGMGGLAGTLGGKTIIPDAPNERIFTLQERGALLQKVHFAAFMLGYDVYLGQRGELGTHVEEPAATFQVRKRSVQLLSHIDSVAIDGRPIPAGVEVPIEGDVVIEVAGQKLEYRDLRAVTVEGWPYVGEIRRPASSTYMVWGEEYQIGRSRECRVVLPDEPRNENIHWKTAIGDGATIRARSGEIPKSRFYTDSIMVASEHAAMNLRGDRPQVVCTARHCFVYVRRAGQILALHPASSDGGPKDAELDAGDEVLIGNCLFHVSYSAGEQALPAPAPMIHLDGSAPPARPGAAADRLVADVAAPNLQMLDRDTGPPAPSRARAPASGHREAAGGRPYGFDIDGANHRAISPADVPSREAPPPMLHRGPVIDSILEPPSAAGANDPDDLVLPDPSSTGSSTGGQAPVRDVAGWDLPDWEPAGDEPDAHARHGRLNGASAPIDLRNLSAGSSPDPFLSPIAAEPRAERNPSLPPRAGAPGVVAVDDTEAQIDLGRPMHLVLVGWVVNGEVVCGNHTGADLVIPESRIRRDQTFPLRNYFRLKVRGRRGAVDVLDPDEVEVDGARPSPTYEEPERHRFDIIRRDDAGERDYVVSLRLTDDPRLPDPRARYLEIDTSDRLSAPLLTRGLPRGAPRTLSLADLRLTFLYDGVNVQVTDYLSSYRRSDVRSGDGRADGFQTFLIQRREERFVTAPEDGSPFTISPGDRMVIGASVYLLRSM